MNIPHGMPAICADGPAERLIARYAGDPVLYVREMLRAEPYPFQERWLQSIAAHDRVSIRANRGPGKTTYAVWAVLWFLHTRALANAIITAPTFERHIKDRFWPEMRKWIRQAQPIVRATFEIEKFHLRANHPGLRDEWFAVGTSSDEPGNMEGFHAPHLLYVVDEAKSVEREIFNAIASSLTDNVGEQKLLLISTPSEQPAGYFYDTFSKWRDHWTTHAIGAFEAKAQGARISDEWIEDRRAELGERTPAWQAQVLGEFPDQGERTLIPLSWVERAVRRYPLYPGDRRGEAPIAPAPPVELGLDVSEGGMDKTIAAIRQGPVLWSLHDLASATATETAGEVRRLVREWDLRAVPGGHAVAPIGRVKIERTGPGRGVGDILGGVQWFVPAAKAHDRDTFHNLRAEAWWALRKRFEENDIAIPDDDALIADLSAMDYEYTNRSRLKMPDKKKLREKLGRSPDRGDAAMIAFARLTAATGKAARLAI